MKIDPEVQGLAFRLYLRNYEPKRIASAIAREHGVKVDAAAIEKWVAARLDHLDQDPQLAKTVSAINEANRELWAAAAGEGVKPAAKASYLQAIARNEERLIRIDGRCGAKLVRGRWCLNYPPKGGRRCARHAAAEDATPATRYVAESREGRCGARGRGTAAALFCDEAPVEGRTRCRVHGGASPRAAAHPRFKTGLFSNGVGGLEIFVAPFAAAELRLIDRWRRDPEEALRLQLAEGAVVQRRALRAGNVEAFARLGTMTATTARALVSLREVPQAERGLPKVVEVFEGKTLADFEHDLEVIRRDASAGVPA